MVLGRAWRVLEALALLVVATTLRTFVPMPRWSFLLGTATEPTAAGDFAGGGGLLGREAAVASAVNVASWALPYQPNCLDRATAAQVMLRLRRQPGRVVIGLAPRDDWKAHAWLMGGSGTVVGGEQAAAFTAATVFIPGPRATSSRA